MISFTKALGYAVLSTVFILSIPIMGGLGEGVTEAAGILFLKKIAVLCLPPLFVGYFVLFILLTRAINKWLSLLISLVTGCAAWIALVVLGLRTNAPMGMEGIGYLVSSIAALIIGALVSLVVTIKR
ncbi:MAG: hypothetical protein WC217_02290 [Candidatus Paceibacterota bacterium]|jgi:hypothetical protein